jgi:hypothetical protein
LPRAALFIREGLKVRASELDKLGEAIQGVEEAKERSRKKARDVFRRGRQVRRFSNSRTFSQNPVILPARPRLENGRMSVNRRSVTLFVVSLVTAAGALAAHDMFLKLPTYFLEPNADVEVALVNGTFDRSENVITRDRMSDVSIVGPGGEARHPRSSAWRDSAVHHENPDSVDTSILSFRTGGAGTYVIGVSTKARALGLSAEDFNAYLEHDGVLDVLEARVKRGETDRPATERYSKHVKAIVQVGEDRTDTYGHKLDYPAEFVPLRNPYDLTEGDTLGIRFLHRGQPVSGQLVYASYEGYHAHVETDAGTAHREAVGTRTDSDGVARIPLSRAGRWYARTIHMVATPDEPDVDYESNWATVTFEVGR